MYFCFRILLKFEKLRVVLAYIKAVFISRSGGSDGLNYDGLKSALKILHGPMERFVDTFLTRFPYDSLTGKRLLNYSSLLIWTTPK